MENFFGINHTDDIRESFIQHVGQLKEGSDVGRVKKKSKDGCKQIEDSRWMRIW
jgi:hypothetical protein